MAKFEAGIATSATTSGVPLWELRAPAARVLTLRELVVTNSAATAARLGLGRPATAGTASGTSLGQAIDPVAGAALGTVAATWSAAPTSPTIFTRRINLGATIGAGASWTWGPDELSIAAALTLVLWTLSTVGIMDVYAKWEE